MIPALPWRCRLELPPVSTNNARLPVAMQRKDGRSYTRLIKAPEIAAWEQEQGARIREQNPPHLDAGTRVLMGLRFSFANAAADVDNCVKSTVDLLRGELGRPRPGATPRVVRKRDGTVEIKGPKEWDDRDVFLILAHKEINYASTGISVLVDWYDEALIDHLEAAIVERPRNAFGIPLPLPRRCNLAVVQGLIEEEGA